MKRLIPVLIILALLVGGGGTWWYFSTHPEASTQLLVELGLQATKAAQGIAASGFIEAEEVSITAEVGGRIAGILVDEGDEVERDQVLVRLDDALLQAQLREAEAALEMAQAQLAQVQAGARPEAIRQAEAALAQAKVARDGAKQAWEDAQAILENPQELNAEIDAARTQLAGAERQVKQAMAAKDAAGAQNEMWGRTFRETEHLVKEGKKVCVTLPDGTKKCVRVKLPESALAPVSFQWNLATKDAWAAWADLQIALAAREAAQANLDNLLAMREKPLTMEAQVDAAQAQYEAAQAAVAEAQAQVDLLRAGATKEEVAMAEAEVSQAKANLEALQVQLAKMTLTSPLAGLVTERMVHQGEMAAPGATLLTVADLEEVTLTVYVPENRIGRVKVRQEVEVTVDSYPGRTFAGRVVYIASQAEFTPKNVQTEEERVNMVFAVKVKLPNPDHALKPGMPADAVIRAD